MCSDFSLRTENLSSSPIREILEVINRPGMVSFAGGLPSPDSFARVDAEEVPPDWLQYGPSEGEWSLREQVAQEVSRLGLRCETEQVLILSGSQQGIDLAGKLFVDPGTPVALESPTYLAALQVFRFFGARFVPFDRSAPEDLREPPAHSIRLLYTVPTFQNPTGACYSSQERRGLAAFCDENRIALFEDDPYRELAYEDCDRTPVCAQVERTSWIYQSSFSKSLAPGLRIGYLVASPDLLPYLTRLKQAADLHSSRVGQLLVLRQLSRPEAHTRPAALAAAYRAKRDRFAALLEKYLAEHADWQVPPGGLFFWLRLKQPCDTRKLLTTALERGVAFMPGEPFFPFPPEDGSYLRLNFSHADAEQADRGLRTLSDLLCTGVGND